MKRARSQTAAEALAAAGRRLARAQGLAMLRAAGGRAGKARNKRCPCGSGRKYKNCCLPKLNGRD